MHAWTHAARSDVRSRETRDGGVPPAALILPQNAPEFPRVHFEHVSSQAVKLIRAFLCSDPAERKTCVEALKDAWLQPDARRCETLLQRTASAVAGGEAEASSEAAEAFTDDAFKPP